MTRRRGARVGRADSRFPPETVGEALPGSVIHAAKRGFFDVFSPNTKVRRKPPLKGEGNREAVEG